MDKKYMLSSLENTLKIVEVMSDVKEISIKELSEKVGLANSTVYRILNTLLKYDYVTQNETTLQYSLGFKFVNIADAILQKYDIITITRDCIEEMVEEVNENMIMRSFANDQVTIIEDYSCHKKYREIYDYTGAAYPAYASSAGNAYLAYFSEKRLNRYLEKISLQKLTPYTRTDLEEFKEKLRQGREKGYFECNQEVNEGVVSFAAPIFDKQKEIESVIAVYGAASEMEANREQLVARLKQTAAECTAINCQKKAVK